MAKLNAQGRNLTDLISSLQEAAESKEIRLSITESDFLDYGNSVLRDLQTRIEATEDWKIVSPNFEGIRVKCTAEKESGWFLLRMSLHDPVMPLNIESDIKGGVQNIAERLEKILTEYKGLNVTAIKS